MGLNATTVFKTYAVLLNLKYDHVLLNFLLLLYNM